MKRTIAAIALAALCMTNFTFAQNNEREILGASPVNHRISAPYAETGSKNDQLYGGPESRQLAVGHYNNDRGMIIGMYRPPGTLHNPTSQGEVVQRNHTSAGDPGSNLNDGAAGHTSVPQLWAGDGPGIPNPPPCCRV